MRITRVEIENFRSIEKLVLKTDQAFVILEGDNDVGKSNVLQAIDLATRHIASNLSQWAGSLGQLPELWPSDYRSRNVVRQGTGGARVTLTFTGFPESCGIDAANSLAFSILFAPDKNGRLDSKIQGGPKALAGYWEARGMGSIVPDGGDRESADFVEEIASAVRHVGTTRTVAQELVQPGGEGIPRWTGSNLKSLLLAYKNAPQEAVQQRFELLRARASDDDLPIGDLFVGFRGSDVFASTKIGGTVFDLEDRASGVQQLVFLLALAICHAGSVLLIEEPELNLSKPLQRSFWTKLKSLTGPGQPLEQIFVTSHSEYFETQAEKIKLVRTTRTGPTVVASQASPNAPILTGESVRALPVTRAGSMQLDQETLADLGNPQEKLVYVLTDDAGRHLLSADEFGALGSDES